MISKHKNGQIYVKIYSQNINLLFKLRYNEIFFMIDTCQAASMFQVFFP